MNFKLIPRVRVNYTFYDLLKASLVSECNHARRNECLNRISVFYRGYAAMLVPSSRDAIYELLIRLPQKKVVIPSYTCMVVNEAIGLSGKQVVYAKSDLDRYNSSYLDFIDGDCIVLATHQYGIPCNIKTVAEKCKAVGAVLIEDCATSMGTTVNGQMTGTFGDYAVVSLNQSKSLTVPPFGGILIGKNDEMLKEIEQTADWIDGGIGFKVKGLIKGAAFVLSKNPLFYRLIHWTTIDRKGKLQRTEHEQLATEKTAFYKVRFTEWQASILLRQLKEMEKIFARRKEIYAYYDKHINNPLLIKPAIYNSAVCTRYAVLCDNRKAFYKECLKKGVDMDFSHCRISCPSDYKVEHEMADKILNLPFYYDMTDKEMKKVVDVVNSVSV